MSFRALNNGNLTLPQVQCSEKTYFIPEKLNGAGMSCSWCGGGENLKKCQKCHLSSYCSIACQRNHWRQSHKQECRDINETPELGKIAKRILSTLTCSVVSDSYTQLMRVLDTLDGLRPCETVIDCDDMPASSGEGTDWRDEMAIELSKRMKIDLMCRGKNEDQQSDGFTRLKFRVGQFFVYHVYTVRQNVYYNVNDFCSVNKLNGPVVNGEFDAARFLETISVLEKTIKNDNAAPVNRDQIVFLTCVRFALRLGMGDLDFALLEWISRKGCNKKCPFVKSAMQLGSKLMRNERDMIDLTNGFDMTLDMLLNTIGDGVMDGNEILLFAYFYAMWL